MSHNGLMLETALWVRGAINEHTEGSRKKKQIFYAQADQKGGEVSHFGSDRRQM